MIPTCLINPVKDVTVYKGPSLENFSVVGSEEIVALNRVIADLVKQHHGQVSDKYGVEKMKEQTQLSMDPQVFAQLAQLLCTFSDVSLNPNEILASATSLSTEFTFIRAQNR